MNAFDALLSELEASRDMAYMDAKESRTKTETLELAVIKLRNAIIEEKRKTEEGR